MELPLSLAFPGRQPVSVVIDADPATPLGEVADALAQHLGVPIEATGLFAGQTRLDPAAALGECRLVRGAVIGVGVPVAATSDRAGTESLELAVVGGPAAGAALALDDTAGVTVGRGDDNDLVVDDGLASRSHARFTVSGRAAVVEDLGSRNGVGHGGLRIAGPEQLAAGDVVQIGDSVLEFRVGQRAADVLDPPAPDGTRRFNRPPRLASSGGAVEVHLPSEPVEPKGRRLPLLSMLAPLGIGAVMVLVTKNLSYAAFVIFSPLIALVNVVTDRSSGRKQYRADLAAYRATQARVEADVAGLVAADEQVRRAELPDPAALVRIAAAPTSRLWERRVDDPDFLTLRVGLADAEAHIRLRDVSEGQADHPTARLVPASFDLDGAGVAGIAGPRPEALAWARAAIGQIAALHSPGDVRVVILTGADGAADWEWALWLPHLAPPEVGWGCTRLAGAGRHQVEARLASLHRLIEERLEVARTQLHTGRPRGSRIVVVIDGARGFRALDGVAEVLQRGPEVGVLALCIDDAEHNLPEECKVTIVAEPTSAARVTLHRKGSTPVSGIIADGMDRAAATRMARALAPVVDLAPRRGAGGELPGSVRLLDLLGLDEPSPDNVLRAWSATDFQGSTASPGSTDGHGSAGAGRSTEAVIGMGGNGPFAVDLRRDGPHGLLAGTTGAGKSELLQTLVASLALGNRPDALSFVLVDYKGGSAFKDCRDLPHCAGMITDLDGHLAARALASLTAELKRRETLFAEADATNIDDYWAKTDGTDAPRLGRLAIVVDEFASLVEEVPEFVKGVIGIGMRGRSLGVHVVLATQRPGGVVTGDLRANLNLRICLRVANPQESTDVIDVPDAARLSRDTPGRAYALTGYRDLTLFQTARVGGSRPAEPDEDAPRQTLVRPLSFAAAGTAATTETPAAEAGGESDLSLLVRAIATAATTAGVELPPSPWLAPLPDVIPAATLPAAAALSATGLLSATVGVIDVPESQSQRPLVVDLAQIGSLAVIGAVRSGRSTALRTIAAGLAAGAGPEDLHLYVLDCGNRALEPLAALPHTGAVVDGEDPDRVARLLDLLAGTVTARTRAGIAEPPVVLFVDRFDAFRARYGERDAGRLAEVMDRLLREGPAVGLHFVVSGDRTAFTSRLASAVESRLVLRQADRTDFSVMGLNPRETPTYMPNGRAVWAQTGHEVQVAALGDDASEEAQLGALAALADEARRRWPEPRPERRPRRVQSLPDEIHLDALTSSTDPASKGTMTEEAVTEEAAGSGAVVTLGVGGDELDPVVLDLAEAGPSFVIAGPARSGRSSALATLVRSLSGRENGKRSVVIVAPRPSPLRDLADLPGVAAVLTAATDLGPQIESAVYGVGGPVALVVDDAELLTDPTTTRTLEGLVRAARDIGLVVVAAATTEDLVLSRYRGWLADARRSRTGILLTPSAASDGELFELRLPRSTSGVGWPPGRGLLAVRGRAIGMQVALPD